MEKTQTGHIVGHIYFSRDENTLYRVVGVTTWLYPNDSVRVEYANGEKRTHGTSISISKDKDVTL